MTEFLLDTNIVSASAPTKGVGEAALVRWMQVHAPSSFVSTVTIMEIEDGVLRLGRTRPGARSNALALWMSVLLDSFDDRILAVDLSVARRAAELRDHARSKGHDPDVADTLIAATALAHQLTIVTRNTRHFRIFDLPMLDPIHQTMP